MIRELSLGLISDEITFILLLCGALYAGYRGIRNGIKKLLEKEFTELGTKLDKLDMATCKNFLVRCLADFEKGAELSEIEKERFWEQYEHYKKIGGNTYISEWTERLKQEGKI